MTNAHVSKTSFTCMVFFSGVFGLLKQKTVFCSGIERGMLEQRIVSLIVITLFSLQCFK